MNDQETAPREPIALLDAEALASAALRQAGLEDNAAQIVARTFTYAERDGIASHGLARIPGLCETIRSGRVAANAKIKVTRPLSGLIRADADGGFPQPAFEAAFEEVIKAVEETGIACLSICNGWAADVMGWHVERFAERGYIALGFANVPAAIAPAGGSRPVFGTNPVCCASPRAHGTPVVIDQASSVVAKSEVMEHASTGKPIPLGWALDRDGKPTTDASLALMGSMAPFGGYKGVGIAFIVELMTAIVSGSQLSLEAPPLAKADAPGARISQTFIVPNPGTFAGEGWPNRVASIADAISSQPGARLPGDRRIRDRKSVV